MRASLAALALLLTACAGAAAARRPTLPEACAGGTVTREVSFPAADGLVVHAMASNPCGGAPRPVVVLVHQMCRDRGEWGVAPHDWQSALAARGLATLAIDLRGHGASRAWPDGSTHDLCGELGRPEVAALYAGMLNDAGAAVAYAREALHAPAVALVGSSIGANSALVVFAREPGVAAVVALSPGLDYRGIRIEDAVASIGGRPALLLAAVDDQRSAEAVKKLKERNPRVTADVWPDGEHGNHMIDTHPDRLGRICDWLMEHM